MAATSVDAAGSGTRALQRVLHHYVRSARKRLGQATPSDEAVHEARKAIKKSRTALRLLRPCLRKACYQRANGTLRDAAHVLNALRDARVLIQALSALQRRTAALRANPAAARLAARLRQELSDARHRLNARTLRDQCRTLRRVERGARELPIGRHDWSVLGPAMRHIYRRGRYLLPTASGHPADAALHAWRKHVKYLRYALKMLGPIQPGLLGALAKQADGIGERLGEAHDLALLHARAQLLEGRSGPGRRHLLQAIERERTRRAFAALVAGERLFQPRPREFEHTLERAWHRWHRRRA
ncbi:MAG TPA: CHAD domain-containing protein [Steroidobacteraceae bacterium]|nr:CHAD domain-containing protein [Steroidobacteraceae bacterium]